MTDTREGPVTQGSHADKHVHVQEYRSPDITVTYDTHRCLHAAECARGLPSVFDVGRRPWVDPSGAAPEDVAATIRRCPSGALRYTLTGGEPEAPAHPTRVHQVTGGPLLLRGHLVIDTPRGHVHATRAAMCVCRHSANQPFCDGSDDCLLSGKDWPRA